MAVQHFEITPFGPNREVLLVNVDTLGGFYTRDSLKQKPG